MRGGHLVFSLLHTKLCMLPALLSPLDNDRDCLAEVVSISSPHQVIRTCTLLLHTTRAYSSVVYYLRCFYREDLAILSWFLFVQPFVYILGDSRCLVYAFGCNPEPVI